MGYVAAIIGSAASTMSKISEASSASADAAINASGSAGSAVDNGLSGSADIMKAVPEAFADDTSDIMKAGEEAAKAETEKVGKSFFSRAWDESKNSLGIGENGADMGKVGYNAAKIAVSKSDNSDQQKMDYAPAQTTAPAAPAANAEDELNKLRNRMNV